MLSLARTDKPAWHPTMSQAKFFQGEAVALQADVADLNIKLQLMAKQCPMASVKTRSHRGGGTGTGDARQRPSAESVCAGAEVGNRRADTAV